MLQPPWPYQQVSNKDDYNYYDYLDDYAANLAGGAAGGGSYSYPGAGSNSEYGGLTSRDGYDHHDTYYHETGCYEEGVSIALLLTTGLGILLMGWVLYQKVRVKGNRRRRELDDPLEFLLNLSLIITSGRFLHKEK